MSSRHVGAQAIGLGREEGREVHLGPADSETRRGPQSPRGPCCRARASASAGAGKEWPVSSRHVAAPAIGLGREEGRELHLGPAPTAP